MKLIDVAARNSKEVESILRKVRAWIKQHGGKGCNTGALRFGQDKDGSYWIELENDGKLGDDLLADAVRKSPNGRVLDVKEYEGSYDWSSDTYARPSSIVTYRF